MYICELCGAQSPPRQPRLTHVVERDVPHIENVRFNRDGPATRREIAREFSVCPECKARLERGDLLGTLLTIANLKRQEEARLAAAGNGQPTVTATPALARPIQVVEF